MQNGNGNGNGNDQSSKPQRRKVERWETLEVLHVGSESTAKADIGLAIEIKQPIFEDGFKGFPKMSATLNRGDRFLRFTCFDGDVSEIKALANLLNAVDGLDGFPAVYDKAVDEYKAQGKGRATAAKPGGVGGGLSRFSDKGEGKTERRRRKRRTGGEKRP